MSQVGTQRPLRAAPQRKRGTINFLGREAQRRQNGG